MQTRIAEFLRDDPAAAQAAEIIGRCVHCGFCTATCPTYQLLGDELDSPRGRIHLIRQVIEGQTPTEHTRTHLDRCLTCRACETTCPSGVEYGRLLDIGRHMVAERTEPRPLAERTLRRALPGALTSKGFATALRAGQALRPLLPQGLRAKVPAPQAAGTWPSRQHTRRVLLLAGCVQPGLAPNINAATARVLDAAGIQTLIPPAAGCCGALRYHLDDHDGGLADARRNIDAWWPLVEGDGTCEAIVMNASGCGSMVKDYGHLLRDDPAYAHKAQRISALTLDLAELAPALFDALRPRLSAAQPERIAFHPPCSLQHAQKIRGTVEALLTAAGAEVLPFSEMHLCCGSAGTYSVLQPRLAHALRERKLGHLSAAAPQRILSANIGCIVHLAGGTSIPVQHWIEWLDARLAAPAPRADA